MPDFGYAGAILRLDLGSGRQRLEPSAPLVRRFIGGRGLAAAIFWAEERPAAPVLDPANPLIFATGPATGFPGLASSRWQVCGKSPASDPAFFSYANLGGAWGVHLKYAGLDGLVLTGACEKPAALLIRDGRAELHDAAELWGRTTFETCAALKARWGPEARVLAIGPAGERRVRFATLMTDDASSGSGGFGAVMGAKRLKAVVVLGDRHPVAADPESLRAVADRARRLKGDAWGGHSPETSAPLRPAPCFGCQGCFRRSFQGPDGTRIKYFCQAAGVYRAPALSSPRGGPAAALAAVRFCDGYGLDAAVVQPLVSWLLDCRDAGLLDDDRTGLPLSEAGSARFIEALLRQVAFREGFGDLLAQGPLQAAETLGPQARALLSRSVMTRANELKDYDPRLILANALLYATEPRRPIQQLHEMGHSLIKWLQWRRGEPEAFLSGDVLRAVARSFWGGAAAADFSACDGKAAAAKAIQDRAYAKESLILCDIFWPVKWAPDTEDHVGDPTLESRIYAAITGVETDEAGLNALGERIFNLQRLILLRQGWGGRAGDRLLDDLHEVPLESAFFDPECLVPGPGGEPVSRRGAVVGRDEFERLKTEYYALRGWDADGRPTRETLRALGLDDVAARLGTEGLPGRPN